MRQVNIKLKLEITDIKFACKTYSIKTGFDFEKRDQNISENFFITPLKWNLIYLKKKDLMNGNETNQTKFNLKIKVSGFKKF